MRQDEDRRILDLRARALAQPLSESTAVSDRLALITFSLANECYGIPIQYVREVCNQTEITPLPGAPEPFLGIVNFRGELLPVVELACLLGSSGRCARETFRILALGESTTELGIVVDAVHGVTHLSRRDVVPGGVVGDGSGLCSGVGPEMLMILDGKRLLEDKRLFICRQAEAFIERKGE